MIEVKAISEEKFLVKIHEENSTSEHIVTLPDSYYRALTNKRISKEELIKKSFEFLLEREPKESILSHFELKIIGRYFPEYEKVIKQ